MLSQINKIFLATLICFNLAIVLIRAVLPRFNALMDTNISIQPGPEFIITAISLFILTVILSGIYPAIRYSMLKPVDLMKSAGNQVKGKSFSRYFLTTFQFILAIIFIQFMMIMGKQGRYLDDYNIKGYDAKNVLCISM